MAAVGVEDQPALVLCDEFGRLLCCANVSPDEAFVGVEDKELTDAEEGVGVLQNHSDDLVEGCVVIGAHVDDEVELFVDGNAFLSG